MIRTALIAVGLTAALTTTGVPVAAQDITINFNGRPLEVTAPPVQQSGRVLVAMRDIFEAMGASIEWNSASRTVTATQGTTIIVLTIGSAVAYVDGRAVPLDVPAQIISSSTYVPLRFVAESTGATVDWDGATRTVSISAGAGGPLPPQESTDPGVPAPAITGPRPNQTVGPAVDVVGRTIGGSTIRIVTYVHRKDTGERLSKVPGIVHIVPANGRFSHRIALPTNREFRPGDLYYDIHAWTVLEGEQSKPTVIRVYRK